MTSEEYQQLKRTADMLAVIANILLFFKTEYERAKANNEI